MSTEHELTAQGKAVLVEIRAALQEFADNGRVWTIFLDKMGLTFDDRLALRQCLGQGMVTIKLADRAEPAEWMESGISGVWLGVFYNHNQKPILETIEICAFPQLAQAQPDDVRHGIDLLQEI